LPEHVCVHRLHGSWQGFLHGPLRDDVKKLAEQLRLTEG
jgi:hypothetical protein